MNAKVFHAVVAKERPKLASSLPISPAANIQMMKSEKKRQATKIMKAKNPVAPSPVYGPSSMAK